MAKLISPIWTPHDAATSPSEKFADSALTTIASLTGGASLITREEIARAIVKAAATEGVSGAKSEKLAPEPAWMTDSAEARQWRVATVEWLEQKYPHYVRRGDGRPARERLLGALRTMDYLSATRDAAVEILGAHPGAVGGPEPDQLRRLAVEGWGKSEHAKLRAFLEHGGYTEALREERERIMRETTPASSTVAAEPDEDDLEMTDEAGETLPERLKVVENGRRAAHASVTTSKALLPREGEVVEQSLEDVLALGNPAAGSW